MECREIFLQYYYCLISLIKVVVQTFIKKKLRVSWDFSKINLKKNSIPSNFSNCWRELKIDLNSQKFFKYDILDWAMFWIMAQLT